MNQKTNINESYEYPSVAWSAVGNVISEAIRNFEDAHSLEPQGMTAYVDASNKVRSLKVSLFYDSSKDRGTGGK